VKPGNLHLTLRFLGDIEEAQVEAARKAAAAAVAGKARFRLAFGAPGAFPTLNRPRVVWLGVDQGRAELIALAADLELALVREGLGRADKPFAAHLTIARARDYLPPNALPALFQKHPAPRVEFVASQLELIRSQLHSGGSIYTRLEVSPLGAPAA
jgi:2'-5' RNA ligase